ncbi:MAG TPA: hypothetical protein VGD40_23490 [Chryseosolibacter sp.]
MRRLILLGILAVTLLLQQCGLMPPRRQYIKEAKQQITPTDLLNTHWTLESWNNKLPDCRLTMDFYEKGRFTFKWNDLDFAGDNLWYIVNGSQITFQTRPIEKIVWTDERYELEPDNFALDLSGIKNYKVENDKLILTSTNRIYIFKRT